MAVVKISNQGFFQELRRQWTQNPVVATLKARLRPMEIPFEVIPIAGNMLQLAGQINEQITERIEISNIVNSTLGTMGISGSGSSFGGGLGFGLGVPDLDEMLFYGTMATIRSYQGNPPAMPALKAQAAAILQGQVDPMQALVAGVQSPGEAQLLQGLLPMLGPMLGGILPILQKLAFVMAALAVPQEQISGLLAASGVAQYR